MKTHIVLLASLVLALSGCGSKSGSTPSSSLVGGGEEDLPGDVGGGVTTPVTPPKATLSVWCISNHAWCLRLDAGGANLSNTPFTFAAKYSDTSETQCANARMSGTESAGTITVTSCVDGGGMSSGFASVFETTPSGTYTNNGTTFRFCRNGSGSCLDYVQ